MRPDPKPEPTPIVEPEPEPEPLVSPKEIAPSSLQAAMGAGELFTNALFHREAQDAMPGQWSFFSTGLGAQTWVGNDGDLSGWNGGTGGFLLGAQRSETMGGHLVQFGLAAGHSIADVDSGWSHAEIDSIHLGLFANAEIDALTLSAALSHAWQDYEMERVFLIGTDRTIVRSETEGATSALQAEAFYDFLWTPESETTLGFGPLITVDTTIGSFNRFKESQAGILNLTYSGETARQGVVGAGALATYTGTGWNSVRAEGGLRVTLESVSGDRAISTDASLAVPGAVFTPTAAALDAERVNIGADAKVHFTDNLFGYVRYDTTRGENLIDHEGWAGLTLKF